MSSRAAGHAQFRVPSIYSSGMTPDARSRECETGLHRCCRVTGSIGSAVPRKIISRLAPCVRRSNLAFCASNRTVLLSLCAGNRSKRGSIPVRSPYRSRPEACTGGVMRVRLCSIGARIGRRLEQPARMAPDAAMHGTLSSRTWLGGDASGLRRANVGMDETGAQRDVEGTKIAPHQHPSGAV